MTPKLKVAFIVNSSVFFYSHFIMLARSLKDSNHEVHIVSGDKEKFDIFESEGFITHYLPLSRKGTSIYSELVTLYSLYRLLRFFNFDLIHSFTIKPVLYSALLLKFFYRNSNLKGVYSITGMGSLSISGLFIKKMLWNLIRLMYKFSFSRNGTLVIFENEDDHNFFVSKNILPISKAKLVNGAGVDTRALIPAEKEDILPVRVVFLARLLKDKGIMEFARAAKILVDRNVNVIMQVVGDIDENNISSISSEELKIICSIKNVDYLGFKRDICKVYNGANIACLPSYREGLPKSLIEACSCGLPIVTTDTPGCRQIVDKQLINGLLVPIKDEFALADAIEILVNDIELRKLYGRNSRCLAVTKYDYSVVLSSFRDIYNEVLGYEL